MQKADTLIRTKLHLPFTRQGLVSRPRLQEQIVQGLRGPLTLITAPAGFGKTTLVASCVAGGGMPVAWLSLDKDDNQVERFLNYLVAALQEADNKIGSQAAQLMAGMQLVASEAVLTSLINDLDAVPGEMVLVLDDYQLISSQAVHEEMAFLLEHCPRTFHLVIATRSDPPLPLVRLRAGGQVVELRASDLGFSETEAALFLNDVMGLNLDAGSVATLAERTEGWIAGLQMAALALKSIPQTKHSELSQFIKNFSGSNRYILDYLVEEVLAHQPQEIQDFLLRTSILENLCGSLCAAVTGIFSWKSEGEVRTSQQILEYLERSNLFLVSLDPDRQWYRYHHLFASLLRSRLSQSMEAANIQELYCLASQWCESQGLLVEAITQALASPDLTCAAEILEKNILTFFYQAEITQVYRWLKRLPEPLLLQNALLCAVYAATLALQPPYPPKSLPAAEKWMQVAEQALSNDSQYRDLARAFIFKIRSYWARFRGEPAKIVLDLISKAFALLPEDSSTSMDRNQLYIQSALQTNLGLTYWDAGDEQAARQAFIEARRINSACQDLFNEAASVIHLVQISYLHGRLGEAALLCREALSSFACHKAYLGHRTPHSGLIGIQLAEILIEQDELAEVEGLLRENIDLAKWTISHDIMLRGHLALAQLAAARGELAAAFKNLDEAEKISSVGAEWARAQRARLWLALGTNNPEYFNLARKWGQNIPMVEFSEGPPQMDWTISLVVVRLHLAEAEESLSGKKKDATPKIVDLLEWLERQKQTTQARGWTHWEIRLLVCECLTRQSMGDIPGALAALRHAVELAAPGGYVRVFLDEGPPMQSLLAQWLAHASSGPLRDYAIRLLSQFDVETNTNPVAKEKTTLENNLVEPLSQRELEVLHLMALGRTNQEIAQQLIVSRGTVKAHTANIYRKLDVANRTEAVAHARQLGLLP